jgi:hypothetical protein
MIVTKKAIPRRTVLRGLGVTVALPLLDGPGADASRPAVAVRIRLRAARVDHA